MTTHNADAFLASLQEAFDKLDVEGDESAAAAHLPTATEVDLASMLQAAFDDMSQQDRRGPAIPERPRMTAEQTEAYVRANEELAQQEQDEHGLWDQFERHQRAQHELFEPILNLAFNERGAISPSILQRLVVRYMDAAEVTVAALAELRAFRLAVERRRQFFEIQTADVLAHRDAQHALLRPGQKMRVPVGTPTEGPMVTDEDALFRDYGVDLGM